MNVLVTGGCGFIGSNLVRTCAAERPDWKIVNLDQLTYAGNLENLRELEGDSRARLRPRRHRRPGAASSTCWRSTGIDARDAPGRREPRGPLDPRARSSSSGPTCWAPRCLLEACRARRGQALPHGLHGRGLRLAGTHRRLHRDLAAPALQPVLGLQDGVGPRSRSPTTTPSVWTWSSPAARTTTGRYQFPEKLIPLMVVNALHDKPLPVYGDGANVRDWLHVEDHCRALLLGRSRRGAAGEVYNIGGGAERRTSRSVRTHPRAAEEAGVPSSSSSRTVPATTAATPSTRRRSAPSWAGRLAAPSSRAWRTRCAGTWTTRTGGSA